MRRTRIFRTAATIVVLGVVLTSAARAYSTYSSWGTLNVPFYINPANSDVSNSAAISALQAGMATWNTQSGTAFRFGYAGQVNVTTTGVDGKNIILFRNGTSGGTIASTYTWMSGGHLVDADIVFWDGGKAFFTGSSGCTTGGAYIEDIAAHELGHALGLLHSSVTSATMYRSYGSCSQGWRTLSADDIAGAKALYADDGGEAVAPAATLTATARMSVNGNRTAKLVWIGLTSPKVDIYRNGTRVSTKTNDGGASDPVPSNGTYTYKVCAQITSTCTNQATVSF